MSDVAGSRPAERLGDYELIRELGRGGMGVVYEARQLSLNRRVALKVLSHSLGLSPRAVERFRREAAIAARLHHSNIVPIYATGEDHGTHYYAMELVDGPSLDFVIRGLRPGAADADAAGPATVTALPPGSAATVRAGGDPATPGSSSHGGSGSVALTAGTSWFDAVARMFADVAAALDYAHAQGVIHRDIKPSNLMLSADGRLSINDFGLARLLEQPGMTTTGEFMGSPMYMSPEQIAAGRATLDHRTDIYSLGAALYETLTLQPPFRGERRVQVIAQILHKEPRPPRSLNRRIPIDLETICLKSLEKDPDRRYQTAGQMAGDLRRFVDRFAISARRTGPLGRAVKWVRRRPAVAVSVLVALGALGAAGVLAQRAHDTRQEVRALRLQDARERALLAAMGGDFAAAQEAVRQAEQLGASTGWVRLMRGQVALHQGLARAAVAELEQATRLLPDSVAAEALLALAYGEAGQWDRHYALLAVLDHRAPVTTEDHLFKGLLQSEWQEDHGLSDLDEAVRRRDSGIARLIRARARSWQALDFGRTADAEAALEDAVVARSLLPGNPLAIAEHLRVCLVAAGTRAVDDARRADWLAEAARDAEALRAAGPVRRASDARGVYFEFIGRPEEALAAHGPAHPSSRARLLYAAGRFDEALTLLDRPVDETFDGFDCAVVMFILAELPDGPVRAATRYAEFTRAAGTGTQAAYSALPLGLLLIGREAEALAERRAVRARLAGQAGKMLAWHRCLLD